ncbi:transglycosylase SLT domain-containing protein [Candidatus Woesearchaeota archaeon]|nr:transglycosylase SLT domain-containing protein [Candidatus Woesearchaeota archaeon]
MRAKRKQVKHIPANRLGALALAGAFSLVGAMTYHAPSALRAYEDWQKPQEQAVASAPSDSRSLSSLPSSLPSLACSANESDLGLVVSSNKESVWTDLSLDLLRRNGYNAYVQEAKINNDTFYRVVVGYDQGRDIDDLRKSLDELDYFDVSHSFRTCFSKDKSSSLEETLSAKDNSSEITREEFISRLTGYSQKLYSSYWKKALPASKAQEYLGQIYDVASEVEGFPLGKFASQIMHESMMNQYAKGDTKFKKNYSLGLGQMRVKTIKETMKRARKRGVRGIPKKFNETQFTSDPRLQLTLAREFLLYLQQSSRCKGDWDCAMGAYNMGLYNPNDVRKAPYVRKINAREASLPL